MTYKYFQLHSLWHKLLSGPYFVVVSVLLPLPLSHGLIRLVSGEVLCLKFGSFPSFLRYFKMNHFVVGYLSPFLDLVEPSSEPTFAILLDS